MRLSTLIAFSFELLVARANNSNGQGDGVAVNNTLFRNVITSTDDSSPLEWDVVGDGAKDGVDPPLTDSETDVVGKEEWSAIDATLDEDFEDNVLLTSIFNHIPVFSLASSKIKNRLCRKHSRIFLHELKRYKLWALQMFDGGAKLSSGILRGHITQLGDYDECLSVSVHFDSNSTEKINGRYCLAAVDFTATTPTEPLMESLSSAVDLAQSHGFITGSRLDPGHFIPRFTSAGWAFCVPASCSASDVEEAGIALLEPFNNTSGLSFGLTVEPRMCYTHYPPTPLPLASIIAMSAMVVVAIISVVATLMENDNLSLPLKYGTTRQIIQSFSLHQTIKSLVAPLPSSGDIPCIHGLRAAFTAALYVAHKIIAVALVPYANRIELTQLSNHPGSSLLRSSVVYTDSFLLLSGVLTSYNQAKEMDRNGHIDWKKRFIARYIRLTPALLALVISYGFIMQYIGEGPMWGQVMSRNAEICQKYFWRNLLYIQNLFPFQDMCATHTHQLALDMQLSLLPPMLVYLLHANPLFGWSTFTFLNLLSTCLRFMVTADEELSLLIYHGMPQSQLYKTANLMYSLPFHRATPYLFGVALGFFLKKSEKSLRISKGTEIVGWVISAFLAYYALFSSHHASSRLFHYNSLEAAHYAAWTPIAWSLVMCWLIIACHFGFGGLLNTFLCSRPLVLLSRISYCIYLTQFAVFFYNVGTTRSSPEFTIVSAINSEEVIIVLFISVMGTLLFDLPMQEIKGILIDKQKKNKQG